MKDDERAAESALAYATDYHAPVLCNSVIETLVTDPEGTYVDGTLGGAGHSKALLERLGAQGRVIGIDRDEDALIEAGKRLAADVESGRFIPVRGTFASVVDLVRAAGVDHVTGMLLDLGVSSHQLDEGARGFSHRFDGPLDMRMDTGRGMTASEWIDTADEWEIVRILRTYGEEPSARRIGAAIIAARPVTTTRQLADIVRSIVPAPKTGKALARVFQGIRIHVNAEMEELETALVAATELIQPEGRLAVISYHSLEDRRVKRWLRSGHLDGDVRRDLYGNRLTPWKEITRGAVMADESEITLNPRARSARLRVAERTSYTA